jgi:hypothetical protein
MSNSTEVTKKKIHQELQSIRDLCINASIKISNFSKFEIYDNDVQIKAMEDNKNFLNQMIGKFTTLLDTKNIENFIDIKKYEDFYNKPIKNGKPGKKIKDSKDNKDNKDNKYEEHNIEIKHFMCIGSLNEFDIKNGIKVKKFKDFTPIVLPENMLELQENNIKFYYCYNSNDNYKILYLYYGGGDKNYWIGTDNNLYYVDDANNLVVGDTWNLKIDQ